MQAPPECFSLALIGLFFWVETVIVPRSHRFQSLGKFPPAYLARLRACHSPELFAQHFGQTQVLRREFPSESNSLRDRCGGLFCTRRYRLGNVGRRYIHAGPIRSHRRVRAHPSPLPTLQGVDLRRGIADLYGRAQLSPKLQHGIWTLSLPSTTLLPSTNCASDWNHPGNVTAVGCRPSIP